LKTRTRITEAGLRRLVRHFLNETPLAEIPPANPGETGRPAFFSPNATDFSRKIFGNTQIDTTKSSVGYGLDPNDVKVFLDKSKGIWAIFTLPFSAKLKDGEDKEILLNDIKKLAEKLKIPVGTKILVVGDGPYEGDYKNVRWSIGHDIIGHTITSLDRREDEISLKLGSYLGSNIRDVYNVLQKSLDAPGRAFNPEELHNSYITAAERDAEEGRLKAAFKNMKLTTNILNSLIHKSLPDERKLSESETNDIKPDIFASIFLNPSIKLDKQKVINHLDLPKIADLTLGAEEAPKAKKDSRPPPAGGGQLRAKRRSSWWTSPRPIEKVPENTEEIKNKNIISDATIELFEAYKKHVDDWISSIEADTPTLIHQW